LVVEERIDRLVEGRFSGAMLTAQRSLPVARRVPAFMGDQQPRADGEPFRQWFERYEPDVLLSLYNIVFPWLKDGGRRVPQDVGVIQLEWRASHPEIAGMNQHNDAVGEAAVDMVVGQIHRNECGIPAFPRATLIGASWVDGASVRSPAISKPENRASKIQH
jgi:LacI family transcriptional regulator